MKRTTKTIAIQNTEEYRRKKEDGIRKRRKFWRRICAESCLTSVECVLCLLCLVAALIDGTHLQTIVISSVFLSATLIDLVSWTNLRPIAYQSWLMVCTAGCLLFSLYVGVLLFIGFPLPILFGIILGGVTAIVFLIDLCLLMMRMKRYPHPYWILVYHNQMTEACTCTYGEKVPEDEDRPLCFCGENGGERCICDLPPPEPEICECCECGTAFEIGQETCCTCSTQVDMPKIPAREEYGSGIARKTLIVTDEEGVPRKSIVISHDDPSRKSLAMPRRSVAASAIEAPRKSIIEGTRKSIGSAILYDEGRKSMMARKSVATAASYEAHPFEVPRKFDSPGMVHDEMLGIKPRMTGIPGDMPFLKRQYCEDNVFGKSGRSTPRRTKGLDERKSVMARGAIWCDRGRPESCKCDRPGSRCLCGDKCEDTCTNKKKDSPKRNVSVTTKITTAPSKRIKPPPSRSQVTKEYQSPQMMVRNVSTVVRPSSALSYVREGRTDPSEATFVLSKSEDRFYL